MNPINTALTHFINLEDALADQWMVDVDIHDDCNFMDYLEPNENHPEGIKPHLDLAEEEIFVSSGTERCKAALFRNFKAVVMRDISHRVKAYNDYDILSLKLSGNIKQYQKLTAPIPCNYNAPLLERAAAIAATPAFSERIEVLFNKIKNSNLNNKQKQYYNKHLRDFASIYLSQEHAWRNKPSFEALHYHKNESQFLKLQELAKSGGMVSTIGPIGDLGFLSKYKVSVVDTSNIWQYVPIHIEGLSFSTRIVITVVVNPTRFFSCIHIPFSEEEAIEFNHLLGILISCCGNKNVAMGIVKGEENDMTNPFAISLGSIFSHKTISLLRNYVEKNIIAIPGFKPIDITNIEELNTCTALHIEKLYEDPKGRLFLDESANTINFLLPDTYIRLSRIEEWKKAFEKTSNHSDLIGFIWRLKIEERLAEFIHNFGQERMDSLLTRCCTTVPCFENYWSGYFQGASVSEGIAAIVDLHIQTENSD